MEPFLRALSKEKLPEGDLLRLSDLSGTLERELTDSESLTINAIKDVFDKHFEPVVYRDEIVRWFRYRAGLEPVSPPVPMPEPDAVRKYEKARKPDRSGPQLSGILTLAEVYHNCQKHKQDVVTYTKPQSLTLPDGKVIRVGTWLALSEQLVIWLSKSKGFPVLPWKEPGRRKWFLVRSRTTPSPGKPRFQPVKCHEGTVYVDTCNSAISLIKACYGMCKATGVDPTQVLITLPPKKPSKTG